MDADRGVVGVGADHEARRDQNLIVFGLGVDMLDAVDVLTMVSSGLATSSTASGAESPGAATWMSTIGTLICGSSSRGMVMDGEDADQDRGKQEQRRQRRVYRRLGQASRKAELHWPAPRTSAVARRDAREDLHLCRPPSTARSAPDGGDCAIGAAHVDIVDAEARGDILGGHQQRPVATGLDFGSDAPADQAAIEPRTCRIGARPGRRRLTG